MKPSRRLDCLLLLFFLVPYADSTISDLRLCADPECRNAVSSGIATLRYQSIEPMVLSFNMGDEITIYSKEAGQNKELWGAEVRGKRGYIPKRLVKEMRVFVRSPQFTVATELIQPPVMQQQPQQQQQQPPPQQQQQQQPPMGGQAPMMPNQPPPPPPPHQQQQMNGPPQGGHASHPPMPPHLNPQQQGNFMPNQQQVPMMQQQQPMPPQQQQQQQQQQIHPTTTTIATTTTPMPPPSPTTEEALPEMMKVVPSPPSPAESTPLVEPLKDEAPEELAEDDEDADDEEDEEGMNEVEATDEEDGAEEPEDSAVPSVEEGADSLALNSTQDRQEAVQEKEEKLDVPSGEEAKVPAQMIDPMIETLDLPGLDGLRPHSPLEKGMESPLVMQGDPSAIQLALDEGSGNETKPSAEEKDVSTGPGVPEKPVETAPAVAEELPKVDSAKADAKPTLPVEDGKAPEATGAGASPSKDSADEDLDANRKGIDTAEAIPPSQESLPDPTTSSKADVTTAEAIEQPIPLPDEKVQPVVEVPQSPEVVVESPATPTPEEPVVPEAAAVIRDLPVEETILPDSPKETPQQAEQKDLFNGESVTAVDGSGGGIFTPVLNWLGLSDSEEGAATGTMDPATEALKEQIASMDPTASHVPDTPTVTPEGFCLTEDCSKVTPPPPQQPEGFCDKEDCGKLTPPPAQEGSEPLRQDHVHEDHHGHSHDHQDHSDHSHGGHGHSHDHQDHSDHGHGHSHGHHDNHAGHSHDHGHHHHDHGDGFGHGHSHIPGYIPGFGHHYKPPPVAQPPPAVEQPTVAAAPQVEDSQPALPQQEQPLVGVVEEQVAVPVEPVIPPVQVQEETIREVPPIPAPSESASFGNVPDSNEYIPVEEIFEKRRKELEEEAQKEELLNSSEGFFSQLSSALLGFIPSADDLKELNSSSVTGTSSGLYSAIVATSVVAFLTLYYLVQGRSAEKILKARISQLDAQLYELMVAKEEPVAVDETQLTAIKEEKAKLENLVEGIKSEKAALKQKVAELEKEKDGLEKELESATESAESATQLFQELMASQTESDSWHASQMETLQLKLAESQQAVESLSLKAAESEALSAEAEELRAETERYKVRIKTLQSDMETLKTTNRTLQQKAGQEGTELAKLKAEKEAWTGERRTLSGQVKRHTKEAEEWRAKAEGLAKSLKAKEGDLAKALELLKEGGGADSQAVLQLSSLSQLETELAEAQQKIERLEKEMSGRAEEGQRFETERAALREELNELKSKAQLAAREKHEAETKLEVLSNYFKQKETELQKELGTHEAKRAMTEENVTESVRKIIETEENMALYKSQVETLTKEIEEQERSYKSRLAAQEKRAHESWVAARQLERRLEEAKQEMAQLRNRLTQVEKERKEAVESAATVKEMNGTATNGTGPDGDLIKPVVVKRPILGANHEDLTLIDHQQHPALLSPPIPPPPPPPLPPLGLDLTGLHLHHLQSGGHPHPPPPPFDGLYPPPHFIPPPPADLHLLPAIPLPVDHHRPPPLGGMMAPGRVDYDVDFRREMSAEPPGSRRDRGGYLSNGSPPRRYPSPLGSERSVRSDRSDRDRMMDRYDDHFRPVSPYGRHGGGRPRSVGRSRDASPERPRSYSPLPSPLYPPQIHSPEDWDEGRSYNNNNNNSSNRPPNMMRTGSLRHPPSGPKTSSPLIHPVEAGHRHHQQ